MKRTPGNPPFGARQQIKLRTELQGAGPALAAGRLLKPVIISAVIHGLPQMGCTGDTRGKADLATIQNVFLCFKYTFYEMSLRNQHKRTVLLFSHLESPHFGIGQTSDIQPHFTSERTRQPREAQESHRRLRGRAAVGEPVSGLQNEHSRLSPVVLAHISPHSSPTNENTTSAYGAEKDGASAAITMLALDWGLFPPDLSINSVLSLYSILPLQTFL